MLKPIGSEDIYKTELSTLRWLATKQHKNIVGLFASFQQRTEFNLILSYGNKSLKDLWNEFPQPPMDESSIVWLIDQCHGLASALKLIHESDRRLDSLRPEQIRYFEQKGQQGLSGTLKFSDVEEATCQTKSYPPPRHIDRYSQVSPYTSPEHASHGILTQKSDIWALGCLFLDMMTWFLCGKAGLDEFAQKRRIVIGRRATDVFFGFKENNSSQYEKECTFNKGEMEVCAPDSPSVEIHVPY